MWNAFWSGGISNPLEVIEQITYLMFLRRLEDIQENTYDIERAAAEHGGLGLFLRSITGLDYEAATAAFDTFQAGTTYSADQLHFLRLLISYLAKNGTVDPDELFRPPFTGLAPTGPNALFPEADVRIMAEVLTAVTRTAVPSRPARAERGWEHRLMGVDTVLGVDACRGGWVGVVFDGTSAGVFFGRGIADVVAAAGPAVVVVGIDIPIGLPDDSERRADLLARERAGRMRSSVFMTPV